MRFMGTAVNCTASWMAAAEAWAQGDELRWLVLAWLRLCELLEQLWD